MYDRFKGLSMNVKTSAYMTRISFFVFILRYCF